MGNSMIRTYSELIQIPSFAERFKYCQLNGQVGIDTFGFDRYLNQTLYRSARWRSLRNQIIIRDEGCDLAWPDFPVNSRILIHHLNPITEEDVLKESSVLFDPENLICVSHDTHNAIHYGTEELLPRGPVVRSPNDMCPWKNQNAK